MEFNLTGKVVVILSLLCGFFVAVQEPVESLREADPVVRDLKFGDGLDALPGARVKVHMQVWRTDGKLLADTSKRGLPYSFVLGEEGGDQLLHSAVLGMRVGGEREVEGDGRRIRVRLVFCELLSKQDARK